MFKKPDTRPRIPSQENVAQKNVLKRRRIIACIGLNSVHPLFRDLRDMFSVVVQKSAELLPADCRPRIPSR
jgi:hypothetical protein